MDPSAHPLCAPIPPSTPAEEDIKREVGKRLSAFKASRCVPRGGPGLAWPLPPPLAAPARRPPLAAFRGRPAAGRRQRPAGCAPEPASTPPLPALTSQPVHCPPGCTRLCTKTGCALNYTKPTQLLQVPTRVFVTDALPKGPTGKISRRFMVDAFINKKDAGGCVGVWWGRMLACGYQTLEWVRKRGAGALSAHHRSTPAAAAPAGK